MSVIYKQYEALRSAAIDTGIDVSSVNGYSLNRFCEVCKLIIEALGGDFVGSSASLETRKAYYLHQLAVTVGATPEVSGTARERQIKAVQSILDLNGITYSIPASAAQDWRLYVLLLLIKFGPVLTDLLQWIDNPEPNTFGATYNDKATAGLSKAVAVAANSITSTGTGYIDTEKELYTANKANIWFTVPNATSVNALVGGIQDSGSFSITNTESLLVLFSGTWYETDAPLTVGSLVKATVDYVSEKVLIDDEEVALSTSGLTQAHTGSTITIAARLLGAVPSNPFLGQIHAVELLYNDVVVYKPSLAEGAGGLLLDSSQYGNHLPFPANYTRTNVGRIAPSLEDGFAYSAWCDGVDDFFQTDKTPGTSFSLKFSFYVTAYKGANQYHKFAGTENSAGTEGWYLGLGNTGLLRLLTRTGGTAFRTLNGVFQLNTLYNLELVVIDADDIRVYLDGIFRAWGTTPTLDLSGGDQLALGNSPRKIASDYTAGLIGGVVLDGETIDLSQTTNLGSPDLMEAPVQATNSDLFFDDFARPDTAFEVVTDPPALEYIFHGGFGFGLTDTGLQIQGERLYANQDTDPAYWGAYTEAPASEIGCYVTWEDLGTGERDIVLIQASELDPWYQGITHIRVMRDSWFLENAVTGGGGGLTIHAQGTIDPILPLNVSHKIHYTYADDTIKVYINDALVGQATSTEFAPNIGRYSFWQHTTGDQTIGFDSVWSTGAQSGGSDVFNGGITRDGGGIHNGANVKTSDTDAVLLDNLFLSAGGATFDDKTFADYLAHPNGSDNTWLQFRKKNGGCHLTGRAIYPQSKVFTEQEYNLMLVWIGDHSCGAGPIPFPDGLDFSNPDNSMYIPLITGGGI